MPIDLSLYLVTDSTPNILGDRDLCTVVEQAIQGGVTIVQYRDKHADTGVLIETASRLHTITKAHGVPLVINDRVDVALAVGAEGVHLGQDDMDIETARKLLPKNCFIGATVSSVEEARIAVEKGANYLGIGTVFATPTKTNTKSIIGTAGVRQILDFLSTLPRKVGTVAIGGINLSNTQRVIYQSAAATKGLDGVAIVSAIVAAEDPYKAAALLARAITKSPSFATIPPDPREDEFSYLLNNAISVARKVAVRMPLVHSMINYVVANFAANVSLQIGASPIMSPYGPEATDLSKAGGSLLINMGTLNADSLNNYTQAVQAYNQRGSPVVFDPVGGGATEVRQNAIRTLMAGGYFDLIKGNESEIKVIYGQSSSRQIGVDSGPSTLTLQEKVAMVRDLATRERNIVLMTGPVDFLSDGIRTVAIKNGHRYLGQITGTGCVIGLVAAAFLAVERTDKLLAVLAGVLMFEIAAENAALKEYVRGPGTFMPAFLDELYALREDTKASPENNWIKQRAQITVFTAESDGAASSS
ncbi:thiamine-phosphate pyrophosphorylase, putative [Coccidioides posadasii C735 delta SOWgp]|uniref:Thiamine-phosphate pyrophosphorylase n=2 Tax=Coccidioides posadasii TaxID=199306 RepID=A0A0J6I308_COCPO|nr:thiamine-phosphate pyrophosphorylase, putative [Coccidioides posadasii C735 delta SOWgp]EER24135.1 thiamine-phosphate pyrophosphorylase, putative [Coccidioides posadasii C735 delta SOWgp]KMM65737.1 thiamine-phosphate pyrophosphorylase [Coccidioides posadasii RMSCC 3488]|eukprot:XP_003066280.1 thiamine-phosphate pyrophosphorylase, putative [Coccidioides posadasii C735 delta SOWgp]